MMLITKEIEQAFAKQGFTGDLESKDVKIICKLFNPVGSHTWYLYEKIDEDTYMAFVTLGDPTCAECGYISLKELKSLRLPMGLSVERDLHFGSHTLKEVRDIVRSGGHI